MNSNIKQDGYTVLRKVFNKNELNFIIKNINFSIKKQIKLKKDVNFSKGKVNTFHALKRNEKLLKFSKKNILPIADQFLKKKTKIKGLEYFAKPAKVGMESPPHQDNFYWCLKKPDGLNFWIAIDKASKTNGGLYYYKGSHRLGLMSHKNSHIAGSSQTICYLPSKNFKKKYVELNPGDILIHNLLVVHGSNTNTSNFSRRGFVVNVISNDAAIDIKAKKNYLKNLNMQIKKRKK
jgi:phytanoyl-CoA hydroxylase